MRHRELDSYKCEAQGGVTSRKLIGCLLLGMDISKCNEEFNFIQLTSLLYYV